jgi:GTP:adenosylcobinamide-phosphate guanylyltransferase
MSAVSHELLEQGLDVMVLAGDRHRHDPLVEAHGVAGKALIPVAGQPLLAHVLQALQAWPRCRRLVVVAPDDPAYRQAAQQAIGDQALAITWVRACATLPESLDAALALADHWHSGGLLVTADHALLQPEWLDEVERRWQQRRGVILTMVEWASVMAHFPGSRRTRYRLADGDLCGANVFAFDKSAMQQVLALWRRAQQQRKKPWKMVSLLGWGTLVRYLAGQLDRASLLAALSERLGVNIDIVVLNDGRAGVDVDSAADLALVRQVLESD